MLILAASSTCNICENDYNSDKRIAGILPCGHVFCRTCIARFQLARCPVCRSSYAPQSVHNLDYEMQPVESVPFKDPERSQSLDSTHEIARSLIRRLDAYKNDKIESLVTLNRVEEFLIDHLATEFGELCGRAHELELRYNGHTTAHIDRLSAVRKRDAIYKLRVSRNTQRSTSAREQHERTRRPLPGLPEYSPSEPPQIVVHHEESGHHPRHSAAFLALQLRRPRSPMNPHLGRRPYRF